jgi:hypothetical protein
VADPPVIDLRRGLTQEVLDQLRRARRVVLMPKGDRTAALGYWLDEDGEERLCVGVLASDGLPWLHVPVRMLTAFELSGSPFHAVGPGHQFARDVLLDIHDPQHDDFWSRLTSLLRPGDVLRLGVDATTGRRPVLRVSTARTTFALINVPRAARTAVQ